MNVLLYYVTRNGTLGNMEIPSFDSVCFPIPEDLVFVAFRYERNFIKEPPEIFPFTDVERLIMGTEFFDMRYLKDSDFRTQNSQICPVLPNIPDAPIVTQKITIQQFSTLEGDGILDVYLNDWIVDNDFILLSSVDNGVTFTRRTVTNGSIVFPLVPIDSRPFPYRFYITLKHEPKVAIHKIFDLNDNLISNIFTVQV